MEWDIYALLSTAGTWLVHELTDIGVGLLGAIAMRWVAFPVVRWVSTWGKLPFLADAAPSRRHSSSGPLPMVFYPRLHGLALRLGLPLGIALIAVAGVIYLRSVGLPAPEADIALALLLGVYAGLPLLLWSLLTVHRRRVVVDDDGVMVVNAFSSYRIPWDDLHGVELVRDRPVLRRQAGVDNLAFRTPDRSVIADVPRAWYEPGRERPLLAVVKTIEAARPDDGPEPQPEDPAARPGLRVHGVDAQLPRNCPDWILGGAFQLLMVTVSVMLGITFLVVMIYSP